MVRRIPGILAAIAVLLGTSPPAAADEALWALLTGGGQVLVIRHATAPGVGDPAGFRLDDCATQRNLSAAGREEARRLGAALRARGVPIGRVLSSQWCRCLETARLAFGTAEPWAPLNSFFNERQRGPAQTEEVRALVAKAPAGGNLVLVSHQVNIAALTGQYPASGEVIVLTPQGEGIFRVAGRLPPSALPRD
ncbi:MAG: histidine phosphatase family protein [candidate division NC10 bacterium]|nr:histidine phosphatase family protein [candidate division NC10 bacterium]